jgi:hypothetical protein
MKRIVFAALAVALTLAVSARPAQAQYRNVIVNSGNGQGNRVVAVNPGFGQNTILNSGNGIGNVIVARPGAGFYPAYCPPYYGGGGNFINNSGNGINNRILINPGYGYGGFGASNNFISNSGNGQGNVIVVR